MKPMSLENVAQYKKVAGFAFSHTFHGANVGVLKAERAVPPCLEPS